MIPYNKFSEVYDDLYLRNLRDFQKRIKGKGDAYYVDFYPSFGVRRNEEVEFLIYGQAVNGWDSFFAPIDQLSLSKVEESIMASNRFLSSKSHNPLDWVNVQWSQSVYRTMCIDGEIERFYTGSYRVFRSFFWNVVYKLICDYYSLGRENWNWSRKMVWSNLYKIAPEDSNPNGWQKEVQLENSIALVKRELEELSPRYCIVITNDDWWAPFRNKLKTNPVNQILPSEIVSLELHGHTKIIVTRRPRIGNSDRFVKQILETIAL